MSDCTVIVRGIPHIPSVTEVNIRSGPGTSYDVAFTVPVGMDSLKILDVMDDVDGKTKDGKVYQWFKVIFHGGAVGYIRDDLVDLIGDCTPQGYRHFADRSFAFTHVRSGANVKPTPPVDETPEAPPFNPEDMERIRKASFAITQVFEGRGYPAYQNMDSGIVSYGRFQFTLAGGSLGTVCRRYCERSLTESAAELRELYLSRILARDPQLRGDQRLRDLLITAADEDVMKEIQDEVATEGYWNKMLAVSATPRNIRLPLSLALLFDISIHFGVMHGLLTRAEEELNIAPRTRVGAAGFSEEQLMRQVADLRKRSHDRQAERDNLPGLKVRGDFWVALVVNGDWELKGNNSGSILVKGRQVQVRNP